MSTDPATGGRDIGFRNVAPFLTNQDLASVALVSRLSYSEYGQALSLRQQQLRQRFLRAIDTNVEYEEETTTVRHIIQQIMKKSVNANLFDDIRTYAPEKKGFQVHNDESQDEDREGLRHTFRVLNHFGLFDTTAYPVHGGMFDAIMSEPDKRPYQKVLNIIIDLVFTTPTPPPSADPPINILPDLDDEDEDEDDEDEE